ncbi:hypothetical protein OKW35_003165 [Paraburkholderia sp. MM5477-R1]
MRTTRQMSITLPNEMAEEIRRRVRSGETRRSQKSSTTACPNSLYVNVLSRPGCAIRSGWSLPHLKLCGLCAGRMRSTGELEAAIATAGAPRKAAEYVDAIVTLCELDTLPAAVL